MGDSGGRGVDRTLVYHVAGAEERPWPDREHIVRRGTDEGGNAGVREPLHPRPNGPAAPGFADEPGSAHEARGS